MIHISLILEGNQMGDFLVDVVKQGFRIVGWETKPKDDDLEFSVSLTTEEV